MNVFLGKEVSAGEVRVGLIPFKISMQFNILESNCVLLIQ